MKLVLTALTTCTILFTSAQPTQAAPVEITPTIATLDDMIDGEVNRLRIVLSDPTAPAPFARIRRALSARADLASESQTTCDIQARLEQAVDELAEIFHNGIVADQDVDALFEDVCDARIDETTSELINMGRRRLAVPGTFDQLLDSVQSRTTVVATGRYGSHFEEQLLAVTNDLEDAALRYASTRDHWMAFNNALIDSRLESAINRLRFNLARSGGTRRDFRRISKRLRARAELGRDILPNPCG